MQRDSARTVNLSFFGAVEIWGRVGPLSIAKYAVVSYRGSVFGTTATRDPHQISSLARDSERLRPDEPVSRYGTHAE